MESNGASDQLAGIPVGVPIREIADGRVLAGWSADDLRAIADHMDAIKPQEVLPGQCEPGTVCWDSDNGFACSPIVFIVAAIIIGGVIAGELIAGLVKLLQGTLKVNQQDFGKSLPGADKDLIFLGEVDTGQRGTFQITLNYSGHNPGFFKGVELHRMDGNSDKKLNGDLGAWTEGGNLSMTTTTNVPNPDDMKNWYIVLVKGKMFNAHTPMYCLFDLKGKDGYHYTFGWQND